MQDVVIGVDVSTTAVKAIAFDAKGKVLKIGRASFPLSKPHPGYVEQSAEDWWIALATALKDLTSEIQATRISGLALTHQRETFVLIDKNGRAVRPAILWLDERSRAEVSKLGAKYGREKIREWSGKTPDPTPALYGLMWLNKYERSSIDETYFVADTGTYLHYRLTGEKIASVASADPLGIIDMKTKNWRPELVNATGLLPQQLPSLVLPSEFVGKLTGQAAADCGLEIGTPVFAAVGDGQANSLGLGVTEVGSACLSLGSGVVFGMYSGKYSHSDAYRTLTAPDGRGFILETVLRSGMQLLEWTIQVTKAGTVPEMDKHSMDIPPGSEGLLMLPYFSGVMNPWWDEEARGAMVGLSLNHSPTHIFKAAIEGIAFEQALATHAMEESLNIKATSVVASGGGTNSIQMMNCLAATLHRPIAISPVQEAAALGAAMLAAVGAGWFSSVKESVEYMCEKPQQIVEPQPILVESYRPYLEIYSKLYNALKPVHSSLAILKESNR